MATENPDRYHLYERFGATAASNSTSACRECGAIVYFSEAHDRWHDQQDAIREPATTCTPTCRPDLGWHVGHPVPRED